MATNLENPFLTALRVNNTVRTIGLIPDPESDEINQALDYMYNIRHPHSLAQVGTREKDIMWLLNQRRITEESGASQLQALSIQRRYCLALQPPNIQDLIESAKLPPFLGTGIKRAVMQQIFSGNNMQDDLQQCEDQLADLAVNFGSPIESVAESITQLVPLSAIVSKDKVYTPYLGLSLYDISTTVARISRLVDMDIIPGNVAYKTLLVAVTQYDITADRHKFILEKLIDARFKFCTTLLFGTNGAMLGILSQMVTEGQLPFLLASLGMVTIGSGFGIRLATTHLSKFGVKFLFSAYSDLSKYCLVFDQAKKRLSQPSSSNL